MHVCITIESMETIHVSEQRPNAFNVLMASSRDVVLPPKLSPPDGKELRKDQQLYNNLLGILCVSMSAPPPLSLYLTIFNIYTCRSTWLHGHWVEALQQGYRCQLHQQTCSHSVVLGPPPQQVFATRHTHT